MQHRSLVVLSLISLFGASGTAAASDDKGVFGLGIIVGEPTGLSGKYYLGNDTAVDFALGAAFIGRGLQVHSDFLWHPWIIDQKDSFVLPLYFGVGARFLNHDSGGGDDVDHVRVGVRIPVGILFDFTKIPIDVFAEVAGTVDYHSAGESEIGIGFNGGAGVRYYF